MIITIDGPAGSGKSTIARKLALKLGFNFLESGAMYRAITWKVIEENINLLDETALKAALRDFKFSIQKNKNHNIYLVNGVEVTNSLRKQAVTSRVSEISAIGLIREALVAAQRQLAKGKKIVAEGRDLGTVVFPQANYKFFVNASPEVRAQRRYQETKLKNISENKTSTFEYILKDIIRRDHIDSTREISPLKQADDAHFIDTSQMNIDETVDTVLAIINT